MSKHIIAFLVGAFSLFMNSACSDTGQTALTDSQKAMVFFMLANTHENAIHQMRGATENQVLTHKDGHREAVYDAAGKLVQDGINDGSYNYAHPYYDPFGHYNLDIHPWIKMGTSPNDPTSTEERVLAYIRDVEVGIKKASEYWAEQDVEMLIEYQAKSDFPAAWESALNAPNAQILFNMITGETAITEDAMGKVLTSLKASLNETY